MREVVSTLERLRGDESGATAVEYGLIAALVSVALIVTLGTLGTRLSSVFSYVALRMIF